MTFGAALAVDAVKSVGLCGELEDDEEAICIMDAGHDGRHGWQVEP